MPFLPDIAVGAVSAALIAGLVSLLGLIVSKEQKVSEFRQAWIDALRSEISALIAHAQAIHAVHIAGFGSAQEAWKTARDDFFGINEAASSIRLRLNPKEEAAQAVLGQISALEEVFAPGQLPRQQEILRIEKELVSAAQALLKKEWQRVQDGERVYRIARFAALAISAACVLTLVAASIVRVSTL